MMKAMVALVLAYILSFSVSAQLASDTLFAPKPVYGKEARVVAYILDNNHYRKLQLNDSLSSAILDGYIRNLDNNRSYFLESDIKSFEKLRYSIDDLTRQENVTPAYDIYKVFRKRFAERLDYVLTNLVNSDFDFSTDEYYEVDRDKEPWAKTTVELNDIWRRNIKNQALGLKLAGKKPDEIKDILRKRYERLAKQMQQFNSEDVFGVYMNAITEAYDPHTNYLSPKASDLFKQGMSLSLEGIGAQLQIDNDYTKVAKILPGGPAEKSDLIHVNDLIVGVAQGKDGEMIDVVGWRLDEVVKLIKGPKGTTVRLQLLPAKTGVNGPASEITLVRDKIKLEDQSAKKSVIKYNNGTRDLKLGVISLPSFYMDFDEYQKGNPDYRSTTRDVKKLIAELQKEGVDGLVMDLRNNGGGSLAEAIDLTGLFIKEGPVVQVKNSASQVQVGHDDDKQEVYTGPLVVLTNRFSASASEIFAGAIQDYQRGIIAGEQTFGKGTVQTVIDLKRFINDQEEVGELKLTFQKFYRVTGSSTQNKGVTPDVLFPSAFDAKQFGESASPSALPWDVIKSTAFERTNRVNEKTIAQLNKAYSERARFDDGLKKYMRETDELKKSFVQTRVSLNEAKRRAELAEADKLKTLDSNLNTKVAPKEGTQPDTLSELNDEYLREGVLLLSELIVKRIG
jgi:carboxyl-terminal processing protease